jgi:hypothetical protein
MALRKQPPSKGKGNWALTSDHIVQILVLALGNTKSFYFYVPWGDKMTLVCDYIFSTKKEATAFVAATLKLGSVKAIEASEYDVDSDVPQWTKHHASPHPEAQHSDFPWGSSMTFVDS